MDNEKISISLISKIKNNINFVPIITILLVILLCVIVYIYNFNLSNKLKYNKFVIIGILIFIFLELQIFIYIFNTNSNIIKDNNQTNKFINNYKKIIFESTSILSIVLISLFFIFKAIQKFYSFNFLSNIVLFILLFLFIVIILSIIHLLFKDKISDINNNSKSIYKDFIFYIPCLLIDLLENSSKHVTSTPKIGYILLFLLIIVVIAIYKLPKMIFNLIYKNSLLLEGPIYLNYAKELGNFQDFTKNYNTPISTYFEDYNVDKYGIAIKLEKQNEVIPFSYNYEIHSEIYINPQPTNTNISYNNYTNLLNFGNKPKIEYLSKENKIKISCQTTENKDLIIYEEVITNNNYFKLQKWNKIIVKYSGGTVDIFINDHLISTKENVIPHMNYDKIIVGHENGIYGGIKNVYFYNNSKPVNKSLFKPLKF